VIAPQPIGKWKNTYISNIYQLWTFYEVDTLFYGPDSVILTENEVRRGQYHSIRSIEQRIDQIESP